MNNMDKASLGWVLALDDAACRIRFSIQFNAFVREVDKAYPANKMGMAAMGDLYVRSTFETFKRVQRL